ncbi:hypothetical protein VSX60_06005 [Aurantimonas sp. A3-2-R12]|nr:hypothetical protein [Aurantimonas sp. A3-2-R12]
MRKLLGTLSLAGAISGLWDEIVGFIFDQILDGTVVFTDMPEVFKNLISIALLLLGVILLFWPRIVAWKNGVVHEDAFTKTGQQVFVGRTIDISKLVGQEISDSIFVDCDIIGDGFVHLLDDNLFLNGYEVNMISREKLFFEADNDDNIVGAIALTVVYLLNPRFE